MPLNPCKADHASAVAETTPCGSVRLDLKPDMPVSHNEPKQAARRKEMPAVLQRLEALAREELRRLRDVRPASTPHSAPDEQLWQGLAWDLGLDGLAITEIRAEGAFGEPATSPSAGHDAGEARAPDWT